MPHSTEIIINKVVTSEEEGNWKQVKKIQYNSATGEIKVSYEE